MRKSRTLRNRSLGLAVCRRLGCVLAVTAALAACDTPEGTVPAWRGTYLEHAVVTNPNGGGPQVIRWGPPANTGASRD
jgi:hypothetical protein